MPARCNGRFPRRLDAHHLLADDCLTERRPWEAGRHIRLDHRLRGEGVTRIHRVRPLREVAGMNIHRGRPLHGEPFARNYCRETHAEALKPGRQPADPADRWCCSHDHHAGHGLAHSCASGFRLLRGVRLRGDAKQPAGGQLGMTQAWRKPEAPTELGKPSGFLPGGPLEQEVPGQELPDGHALRLPLHDAGLRLLQRLWLPLPYVPQPAAPGPAGRHL